MEKGSNWNSIQKWGRVARWLLPNGGTLLVVLVLVLTANVWARSFAAPQDVNGEMPVTMHYQGRLYDDAGAPLNTSVGMRFTIYDALTDGNVMWGPEIYDTVAVQEGLFDVALGSQSPMSPALWNGDRYLEIAVDGQVLTPRELIRSVPYAQMAGMALAVPAGTIGTGELATNSVTNVHFAWNATTLQLQEDGEWYDDPALYLSGDFSGGNVLIQLVSPGTWCGTGGKSIDVRILVDGTEVATARTAFQSNAGYAERQTDLMWVESLTPGNHTIQVQWLASTGIEQAMVGSHSVRTLMALELKR